MFRPLAGVTRFKYSKAALAVLEVIGLIIIVFNKQI